MKNKFAGIIVLIVELVFLGKWINCLRFADKFYFSSLDLKLRLIEFSNNDNGQVLLIVRLFHNKASGFIFDVINNYLYFFNVQFFINYISILGFFTLTYGIYIFIRDKKKNHTLIICLTILLIYPLIELIIKPNLSFNLKLIILFTPIATFSYFGTHRYFENISNTKKMFFVTLLLLSLLMFFVSIDSISQYCIK